MNALIEQPLDTLDTERVNPSSKEIHRKSPFEIVQTMNMEDMSVAHAVNLVLPQIADAIEAIVARLRRNGRIIYVGAGTSGRLGALDASECPPTFNIPPQMIVSCIAGGHQALGKAYEDLEDCWETGRNDVISVGTSEKDAVIGITASGRTPYVRGAIDYARQRGALTIGLTCNENTPLEEEVEIMISPVVGPEVISGSTRLKAGTAQKMVLNMLSTGAMILMGKTFGNLMIDVQATNHKLQQRALSIIRHATGLDQDAARTLLEVSDGEVKTAILVSRANLSPQQAREKLAAHDYILHAALEGVAPGENK